MRTVISVNRRCNLRCKMCDIGQHVCGSGMSANWLGEGELSSTEWVAKLTDLRSRHVHIQGVEPLLYDGIDELLATLSRSMKVWLTTNGWFLEKHLSNVGACCSNVAVSIDGPTAEIHDAIRGVPGSFDRAVAGLRGLREIWPNTGVRLSFAITPDNYRHMAEYHRVFCRDMGITAVFNHYNYIHPDSCIGYDCKPANLAVYDPASIDIEELFAQVKSCVGNCTFLPTLETAEKLRRWYQEPPTSTLFNHKCQPLQLALAGQRRAMAADGSSIIAGRCWLDEACKGSWPERLAQADNLMREGLPPPCQRLCCAGQVL